MVPSQGDGGDGSKGGGRPNDYPLKLKECRWKDQERGDGAMAMVGGARAGAREPQSEDDHHSFMVSSSRPSSLDVTVFT